MNKDTKNWRSASTVSTVLSCTPIEFKARKMVPKYLRTVLPNLKMKVPVRYGTYHKYGTSTYGIRNLEKSFLSNGNP